MTKAQKISKFIKESSNPFDAITEILAASTTNTQLDAVIKPENSEETI